MFKTLNFANTSKISKNDILSYTPIDNHMLVTSQASFVNSKTFNSFKSIISSLSEEVARTADKLSYKNLSYISNQFLGSPLFYNKNIIGVLSSYKNTKNNHVTMNIVDFYIFTEQDIKNIKNAINMDGYNVREI